MTTNKDIEMIRQSFRPEEIRILFVGESPPVGGTFFYCGNSQMFNNMNRVIGGHLFESTNNFLINFKENGCYLDDLVLSPVNKKSRAGESERGVHKLAIRIKEYQPNYVVALLKRIDKYVKEALEISEVDAGYCCTPFPGNGQQGNFEREIKRIVPQLKNSLSRKLD